MREFKFRAWDGEKFPFVGFDILGEVTVFDICNQYKLEQALTLKIDQYTGLIDRNGIEIYEGDILLCEGTVLPPIKYDNKYCQFTAGSWEFNVEIKPLKCEVIGNIHQHPELLNHNK